MSSLLGVVLIARHGDREGFYQDPVTYTASDTAIPPLGEVRTFRGSHTLTRVLIVFSPLL